VKRPFVSLHVRAFCHATEDLAKVELSMRNVAGDIELTSKRTEGHHGNELIVIEGDSTKSEDAEALLRRLRANDLRTISESAEQRMDESCNLFMRFDKQLAYGGEAVLTRSDDAVSVRVKVSAFPARVETAIRAVREHISDILAARDDPGRQ